VTTLQRRGDGGFGAQRSCRDRSARTVLLATGLVDESPGISGAPAQAGGTAREQHPPTAAMNQATQGGAASPQDVQSQSRGGPTAAQQAEGARRPASENLASAQAALEEARSFGGSGQEAQCMDAVGRAKQFVR
jgi:hypothetical protein